MMLTFYTNILFIIILSCFLFEALSLEQKSDALTQTQSKEGSIPRATVKAGTFSVNLKNGQNWQYSNHQPGPTNYRTNNNRKNINNFPKNHRIDVANTTIQNRKTTGIVKDNKNVKFTINIDDDDEDYKPSHHMANKQKNVRAVLTNLLKRSENNENFASVLPILKVMSPAQRVAMASLVTNQITSEGRNSGLKLAQVKSMFGNNSNATSDLMLPIILDIANLLKSLKDQDKKRTEKLPHPQLLKRSFSDGDEFSLSNIPRLFSNGPGRSIRRMDVIEEDDSDIGVINNSTRDNKIADTIIKFNNNDDKTSKVNKDLGILGRSQPNGTLVGDGNSTVEDMPVAEELRYVNKFRNGNNPVLRPSVIRRPVPPGNNLPPTYFNRRMSTEQRRRQAIAEQQRLGSIECTLFSETLCLEVPDYPMHAIAASIRKNLNVMSALHSDFPELSADSALDGISKKQEEKYTPEHYLNNINRRGDGEPQAADASGFMCPSIVKYARPQKARATSGEWKYIVNTGEHTQTLRLEKCLKPKESCTFLTDNFKSKCVQVYNYHRLLTWDQQNGLHMDIFKVPTCCSCHIEGYNFAYPPHDSKPIEETPESFPGEELIHEADKNRYAFSSAPVRQSVSKDTILTAFRNGNNEDYSSISKLHNYHHPHQRFPQLNTNSYDEVYQTQDSNVHIRKKPIRDSELDTELPSFLEPPSKPIGSHPKNKQPTGNVYIKRGQVGNQGGVLKRPIRKPIRKKISHVVADDQELEASDTKYEVHRNPEIKQANGHTKTPVSVTHSSSTDKTLHKTVTPQSSSSTTETEKHLTKIPQPERGNGILKDISLNRRINYNYHPIIDFFEEGNDKKSSHVASDRIDSSTELRDSSDESDWRPMTGPLILPLKSQSTAPVKNGQKRPI